MQGNVFTSAFASLKDVEVIASKIKKVAILRLTRFYASRDSTPHANLLSFGSVFKLYLDFVSGFSVVLNSQKRVFFNVFVS